MARPLRIEFPGAIYHVMSRGNARQTVFRDDSDYQRLIKGLETVVGRLGWDLLCFVLMPNHFHLLVRTPRPNLSRGMQHLTSGYANWCSRRHRRPGHTFQGRFKSELIEDESYYPGTEEAHTNPTAPARGVPQSPRWRVGLVRARMRNFLTGVILLDRQPLHPPQSRAGQTPARRSPARLALVERSGLRPPAAARWMGGLRGFAFGLAWRVGRQRSRGGLPAVRRAGTGEGSGKPLSVRGAWLAAGQRDVHRADAIAAERAEKPRRGARSPAVGQPGRGDSPGRSGSVLRC